MTWLDTKTRDEFENFKRDEEKQNETMYEQLAEQLESCKAGGYPTQAIEARMKQIAASYPEVVIRILARAKGKAIELAQESKRRDLTQQLVSEPDMELAKEREVQRVGKEGYNLDNPEAQMVYSNALNQFMLDNPETADFLDNSPIGIANQQLLGSFLSRNSLAAYDPANWERSFQATKRAMRRVRPEPAPAPKRIKQEAPKEPKLFTQRVEIRNPMTGWIEYNDVVTGGIVYDEHGNEVRMTADEVTKLSTDEFKRLFKPTSNVRPTAFMR